LRRRNVLRVAAFYAAAGWLLVQVATQVFPFFDIPNGVVRGVVIAIVLGFPAALLFSWFYELTPEGLKLESRIPPGASITRQTGRKLDRWIIAVLALAVVVLAADKLAPWKPAAPVAAAPAALDDKSIAVLPFANLSDDKANAYFATGIQDEILTKLAKVGALKVISRTSTAHYASSPDNLPQIAHELGVANILEGSVQKAGDTVHINVQLIRATGDEHLWAESYDRKLDNIFGVEGEVAQAIAERMNAALSGGDRQALAAMPTGNAQAYDAYLRGVALETEYGETSAYYESLIGFYGRAVELDPSFALAWARLSLVRIEQYFINEHTPALLAASKEALDNALRLQPELPEAWSSLGYYRYWGEEDYPGALQAYDHAAKLLPNNARVTELIGLVQRRQGHWEESLAQLYKAADLDPRDADTWTNIGFSNQALRREAEARAAFARALALQPGDQNLLAFVARTWLDEGNVDAAGSVLANVQLDPGKPRVGEIYNLYWRCRRDYAAGIAAWDQALAEPGKASPLELALAYAGRGRVEALAGKTEAARTDMGAARDRLESLRRNGDDSSFIDGMLGIVYAYLGDKEQALRHARARLERVQKDAFSRSDARHGLAVVETRTGEFDAALADLEISLHQPGLLTVANLRLDAAWDPLRADPRFQKLIAETGK
jgi:TolB-like protein/Tfp pilus assembly protein PilF